MGVCRYFWSAGGCRNGAACVFGHEQGDDVGVCRFYRAGECRFGERCFYRHDEAAEFIVRLERDEDDGGWKSPVYEQDVVDKVHELTEEWNRKRTS